MELSQITLALLASAAAFTLSAAAGLGGSLILVPSLALLLGTKEGIALAAMFLALNNVVKVAAYRHSVAREAAVGVVALTVIGSAAGAWFLAQAPERLVSSAVLASIASTFAWERFRPKTPGRVLAPLLALGAGLSSGFSGTSGPLKGLALRSLRLDRVQLAGTASVVSLAGDMSKTAVYARASLVDIEWLVLVAAALPLMVASTLAGRRLNRAVGERAYALLFWLVMLGYSARLVY